MSQALITGQQNAYNKWTWQHSLCEAAYQHTVYSNIDHVAIKIKSQTHFWMSN